MTFLIICALFGGASRADERVQIINQFAAIAAILIVLWRLPFAHFAAQRTMFVFAGACVALLLLQLVPLPPGLWAALPGHRFYADLATSLGIAPTWRPLSLTPDLTVSSLVATLPLFAMLLLGLATPPRDRHRLVIPLLGIIAFSALLGLLQISGGSGSPLRFYATTNRDSMVGIFSNRNHHALLIAMAFPILGVLAAAFSDSRAWARLGWLLALIIGIFLLLLLLIAGSRAGLVFGGLAAVVGILIYRSIAIAQAKLRAVPAGSVLVNLPLKKLLLAAPLILLAGGLIGFAILSGRAVSFDRIIRTSAPDELRYQLFDPLVRLMWEFMPFGSGAGSFDAVFRRFEPFALLKPTYLNQAHNDLLQLAIEGGLPGLILLGAFLWWWGRAAVRAWRTPTPVTLAGAVPRLGTIITAIQLLASLGDYPLRTPLHGVIFVLGCIWMITPAPGQAQRARKEPERARG